MGELTVKSGLVAAAVPEEGAVTSNPFAEPASVSAWGAMATEKRSELEGIIGVGQIFKP